MLELAILGLLSEQDMHGYEIKKRIAVLTGPALGVSFGSLYPALGRLERSAMVTVRSGPDTGDQPEVPMTGSLSGEARVFRARRRRGSSSRRSRKVYGITDAGRSRLRELLNDDAVDDRIFALKLAFCSLLATEDRADLLNRRRRLLEDRSRDAAQALRHSEDADRYRSALLQHHVDTCQADIAWLDRLAREADAPLGADHGGPR